MNEQALLQEALQEARKGLGEGGLPIGVQFVAAMGREDLLGFSGQARADRGPGA